MRLVLCVLCFPGGRTSVGTVFGWMSREPLFQCVLCPLHLCNSTFLAVLGRYLEDITVVVNAATSQGPRILLDVLCYPGGSFRVDTAWSFSELHAVHFRLCYGWDGGWLVGALVHCLRVVAAWISLRSRNELHASSGRYGCNGSPTAGLWVPTTSCAPWPAWLFRTLSANSTDFAVWLGASISVDEVRVQVDGLVDLRVSGCQWSCAHCTCESARSSPFYGVNGVSLRCSALSRVRVRGSCWTFSASQAVDRDWCRLRVDIRGSLLSCTLSTGRCDCFVCVYGWTEGAYVHVSTDAGLTDSFFILHVQGVTFGSEVDG